MRRRSAMARKRLPADLSPQRSRPRRASPWRGLQGEDVGGLADPAFAEEGLDRLGAEALDVEGAAGDEVPELLHRLGGADQVAGAVVHRLAGLAHHVGAADRAGVGEGVGPGVRRAAGEVDVLDLGDHVAGAVDRHPVADADVAAVADGLAARVAAGDVVGVVQGGVGDDHAADGDRGEAGDRRERAGAADLDVDGLEPGGGALGGELVRERPARGGGAEAEAGLQIEPVDLVDDAVDVVAEGGALRLDGAVVVEHRLDAVAAAHQRVGGEAERGEAGDGGRLGVGEGRGDLAPGVGEEAQRAGGGDARVELAEASRRRRCAGWRRCGRRPRPGGRSGRRSRRGSCSTRRGPRGCRGAPSSGSGMSPMVRAFGVTFSPVSPSPRVAAWDEAAALVAQAEREPVDLRLGGEGERGVGGEVQEAADAGDEVGDVGLGEGVLEAEHRPGVADLGEGLRRGRRRPARTGCRGASARGSAPRSRRCGAFSAS